MKSKIIAAALIFFLAFTARLIYLEQIKGNILFANPASDSGDYHFSGMRLAGWAVTDDSGYEHLRVPFYDNFLKVLYKWGMPDIYFACLVQCFIGSLSCCLIYLLGMTVFDRRAGILAGVTGALYWPFIAFAAKTLPVNLAVFFGLLAALAVYAFFESGNRAWGYAAGIFLAAACLSRPNFLLLAPFVFLNVLVYFMGKGGKKKGLLYSLTFLIGFLFVLGVAGAADHSGRKEFIPVQKNYAVTAYMGTDIEILREMRPGSSWRGKMRELLERGLVSGKERDLYWVEEIRKRITVDPAGYIRGFILKIYILLNRYEFAPYESINYFRAASRFLSMPLPDFGWVASLTILGMVFSLTRPRGRAMTLFIFTAVYFLSLLPFPPLARYRLPLVPFALVFAANCAVNIFDDVRGKRLKELAVTAALLLPLLVLTNTTPAKERLDGFGREYYHEGMAYLVEGDTAKALESLNKALRADPCDADIYEGLGDVYMKRNEPGLAQACYENALEVEPAFPEALEKLGVTYARQGDIEKAMSIFNRVLAAFPTENASTHINLAACYFETGDKENARKELERALSIDPGNFQALYRLTVLYEETGDPRAPAFRARLDQITERAAGVK
jgi:Tfp pilus assembly protein PilF